MFLKGRALGQTVVPGAQGRIVGVFHIQAIPAVGQGANGYIRDGDLIAARLGENPAARDRHSDTAWLNSLTGPAAERLRRVLRRRLGAVSG